MSTHLIREVGPTFQLVTGLKRSMEVRKHGQGEKISY